MMDLYDVPLELQHHGVKGMKWGVRKQYSKLEEKGAQLHGQKVKGKKELAELNKISKHTSAYKKHSESVLSKKDTKIRRGYNKVATAADNAIQNNKKSVSASNRKLGAEYSRTVKKAKSLNPQIDLRKKRSLGKKMLGDALRTAQNMPINDDLYTGRDQFRYDVQKNK